MTDLFLNIGSGLLVAVTPTNLLYCFVGCFLGTLIGVLPGLGPSATIAILLPMTFQLEPITALIMIAGIYYGAQYGGSTTAILVNLPGEASSVVTAIDGHQLAKQGKAGLALSAAALGSFFAGSAATLAIAMFAPVLALAALQFGAVEYFSLMVLGLVASVVLAQGSLVKALATIILGLMVGIIGIDTVSGAYRFTFGFLELSEGVSLVAVAMGLFGLSEIINYLSSGEGDRTPFKTNIRNLWPNRSELRQMAPSIVRGSVLGSVLGLLPGGGALLSSFASYAIEKKISKTPERFGHGAIEGVAGPESANNAGAQTSFVPMLTLGIPSNAIMALMAGAMILHGIQPGPSVMTEQPLLFWGLIASMWVGNLMLVILNLPLVGLWVRMLSIKYIYLFPAIMTFCAIGAFTLANSNFDIFVMVIFGLLGYIFKRLGCEPAPFLLGMILGPMMEEYLRRAMLLSRGDPMVFIERPLSLALLSLSVLAIVAVVVPAVRETREEALKE